MQLCHAVAQAAARGGLDPDTRFVLVSVPDRPGLLRLAECLHRDRTGFCLFEEPDHAIGSSALATVPADSAAGRRFAKLPLWDPSR